MMDGRNGFQEGRRKFITTIARAAGFAVLAKTHRGEPSSAPKRLPNVLLIVADDLGYAELGVQGCKDIPTPNIDSIAQNGFRFTNGYVSCPVCAPTRAGLMTGKYQQRFGFEFNPGGAVGKEFGLPLTELTIAERLRKLGYATGCFGKWHLGFEKEFHPLNRGFDEFYGFLGGAHPYLPTTGRRSGILRGFEPVEKFEFTTMDFAQKAISFIERHRDRPFFVYLAFNAVHSPLEAPEDYLARFKHISDQRRKTFAAMLSAMDDAVGMVLSKLRELKLEENTLVFFISDNGGPTRETTSRNDPLRGFKGQLLEGGIRVPFLVQWKGHLPSNRVYELPVIALDICPTILAAVGAEIPKSLDGVNLLPYLLGEKKGQPHEALFWRYGRQWAVRMGDFKLVCSPQALGSEEPHLLNLAEDVGETTNLASKLPQKVKELKAAYDEWNSKNIPPKWQVRARQILQRRTQRQILQNR
ncbi:MAG: sulfatase [Candidatus Fervidibacter sp.]|uniref:sulfatase n=1 Tax=Candidatus Fervidibacter sp. TaxID=3100871 RepID=UPI00404AFC95